MTKEEALAMDLALEALETEHSLRNGYRFRKGVPLASTAQKAIAAIKQALAKDALYKLAEESCTSGLRLDDWDKIGCVNHDCDKCKAVQEPVAWMHEWDDGERIPMLRKREVDSSDIDSPKSVRPLVFGDITPPAAPVQEPESFEQWNAKQHGDPEEIGFLQALRIAYCAGQDSVTKTTPPAAQPTTEESSAVKPAAPVQEPGESLRLAMDWYDSGHEDREEFKAMMENLLAAPAAQRQWVGLTEDEIDEIFNNRPTYNLDHYEFAQVVEAKVFEKNSATAVVMPDVLNPKDENPAYAAGWNDCRAEMLKGRTV